MVCVHCSSNDLSLFVCVKSMGVYDSVQTMCVCVWISLSPSPLPLSRVSNCYALPTIGDDCILRWTVDGVVATATRRRDDGLHRETDDPLLSPELALARRYDRPRDSTDPTEL